ncbi:class I SAM-dependent methyltransferase [uncultured Jatrophihabitans sp.]|uniref:class I SAM-dependent methyltransferase n=1 Tax=uncultured Jatrophihabitans sp. TaxID=1610747 RepID=UPI0035CB876D
MQIQAGRERPGASRQALVTGLLADALASVTPAGRAPELLDCGGGSGTYAVPLAVAGASVTVVDISADALATLVRRAGEDGVSDRVRPVQGDAESLGDLVPADFFDLVLAHGVLEAVDDVPGAFAGLAAAVRPGGLLSVLVGNPAAGVVARALAGEPAAALAELRALDTPGTRVGPDAVERLCSAAGLAVEARHGIGVFSDLVPGAALDAPGARAALVQLDAAAADRSPFAEIAGRVHLLARRPG